MKKIACIGECMIELFEDATSGPGTMRRTWGGDTLNSAVYLARELAAGQARVSYVTALGDDPYSAEMLEGWTAEGIDTSLTERLPGALPGLYTIRVDERGERDFLYWRDRAAARRLFTTDGAEETLAALAGFDWLYFSGITLAILSAGGREKLMDLCATVRKRGGQVAFDSNFRPRLWPDREEARGVIGQAWRQASVALPTFEDEAALFGDDNAAATVARLRDAGCGEIAVKRGADPCFLASNGEISEVAAKPVSRVVDSTAAGDSFNAAYIAARVAGRPPLEAAKAGHALAARVIGQRGAIIQL
ncbi:MAG: sugar kinase [Proteobacteria bacterium]|nr:sugar kinase [Pseudomonadota bacterium]